MKKTFSLLSFFLTLIFTGNTLAQSSLAGDFGTAGSGSAVLSYTKKEYTEFWAGRAEMAAPNEGLNQSIFSLYVRYAITQKLEVVAVLPYLSNQSKDGEIDEKSIQDFSFFVKGKVYEKGGFTAGLGLGTNIATGYEAKSLYSLGNGATTIDGLALLHYRTPVGLAFSAQGGMSLRSGDVPNAALFMAKMAYAHSHFYLDVSYGIQRSTDRTDIGGPGFGGPDDFPKSKVDYDQLLFTAYVPVVSHFGLTAHFGTILDGRNIGKSNYFGCGIAANL